MVFTPLLNKSNTKKIGWISEHEPITRIGEQQISEVVDLCVRYARIVDAPSATGGRDKLNHTIRRIVDECAFTRRSKQFIVDLNDDSLEFCKVAYMQKFNGETVSVLHKLQYVDKDAWFLYVDDMYVNGTTKLSFRILKAKTLRKHYKWDLRKYRAVYDAKMAILLDQAGRPDASWDIDNQTK